MKIGSSLSSSSLPSLILLLILSIFLYYTYKYISNSSIDITDNSKSENINSRLGALAIYSNYDCHAKRKIPIWSRYFARTCCNVYPSTFGLLSGGNFFEAGISNDEHYFKRRQVISGDIVYVVTSDLPQFIETVFVHLPKSSRIVVVTGCEDIGAPWEIFHPNRTNFGNYNMKSLWPTGQAMGMEEFINDPRLVKWFAQNYDLVGCNLFTCSNIITSSSIVSKVAPVPIGIDFHSMTEKGRKKLEPKTIAHTICNLRLDIEDVIDGNRIIFSDRPNIVHAEFDCVFDNKKSRLMRELTRGPICKLLSNHVEKYGNSVFTYSSTKATQVRESKKLFWQKVAASSFSIAPSGFGVDTHRIWEILLMETVPITLSSTLDILYSTFPIIIVNDWNDIFVDGALAKYKADIIRRFGNDPFANATVINKLSNDYWAQLVNEAMDKTM